MPAPLDLLAAVERLSESSGYRFRVGEEVVSGTNLFVVYTEKYPLPDRYAVPEAVLGFRVPGTFPDASPEDSFFLLPADIKLTKSDPFRNSTDIHRAGASGDHVKGVLEGAALVFSWHIWDRVTWNRRKHTLEDHYRHAIRRFEANEHD